MKTIAISSALFFSLVLCSFKLIHKEPEEKFAMQEIERSVAKISDNLYAGKFEVTNLVYRCFEQDLKKNSKTGEWKNILPDTLNWKDKTFYNEPYVAYYYRHPAYAAYPVVNVSYEAARGFCKWLTDTYNNDPKRKYKKVLFRLPTQQEWETAAKAGVERAVYTWGNTLFLNNKPMCNYQPIGDEAIVYDTLKKKYTVDFNNIEALGSLPDNADVTAPVISYQPNKFGLYNMCGNVAEMVNEKGIAKGGSWRSPGGDVRIASNLTYQKTSSQIGFRYFMEVQEN